jgi:hypothetical protein
MKPDRGAWILVALGVVYVVGFFWLALASNRPPRPVTFDMGGIPFVPASDPHADGYAVTGGRR